MSLEVSYYDKAVPFPPYEDYSTKLRRVVSVGRELGAQARRLGMPSVHEVERSNGDTSYQVVNELAEGVSLLSIDVVQANGRTKGYAIMVDQIRYPHPRPGYEHLSVELAARHGVVGRWSREIISGGVEPCDRETGDSTKEEVLRRAVIREAQEEAGIHGLSSESIIRLMPTLFSSISINRQPFNLFAVELPKGLWQPTNLKPDSEEGEIHVAAYELRDTVPEMISNGMIIELSTVTAINSLYRFAQFRKYLE